MSFAAFLCVVAMTVHLIIGFLVFWRAPGQAANRVFSLLLLLFFFWSLGELLIITYGASALRLAFQFTPVILLPWAFALFTALFPRRLEDSPLVAPGMIRFLLPLPALGLLALLWSGHLLPLWEPFRSGLLLSFGKYEFLAKGVAVLYLLLALKTLSGARRQIDSEFQERRLRYTFAGLVLPAAAGSVLLALSRYLAGVPDRILYIYGLFPALGLVMAGLIGYAILRYRLLEIDLIFTVGLVYTLMTAILAGTLEIVQNLFQNLFELTGTFSTILSTLLIAAFFSPLKDLIGRLVDWFFGKQAIDFSRVIRHLLQEMRQARTTPEVLAKFLRELHPVLGFSDGTVLIASQHPVVFPVGKTDPATLPEVPAAWPVLEDLDAILEAGRESADPELGRFAAWRERGFRLGFPIRREEKVIGAVFLAAKSSRLPYSPEEKGLVESLCAEIPPIIETLSLIESLMERDRDSRDLQWAAEMYRQIRADNDRTSFIGLPVRCFSVLAPRIKGDLIDIDDRPGSPFIAICDAFHEGIQAALTLQITHTALRTAPAAGRAGAIHAVLEPFSSPPLRTALSLVEPLDEGKGLIRLTNAGNPSPLLIDGSGKVTPLLPTIGKPLGMQASSPPATTTLPLQSGQILLCFTNGLATPFGDESGTGLAAFLQSCTARTLDGLHQALQKRLLEFPDSASRPDDITYVLIGGPHAS